MTYHDRIVRDPGICIRDRLSRWLEPCAFR